MIITATERIATLIAWCSDNSIKIDPRIRVRPTGRGDDIAVFSVNAYIDNQVSLVQIPKSAVLSVRSCSISDHITTVPYGHGAHLSLALALYTEILLAEKSRWFGYIQSLPQELVDIALFWGNDGDHTMDFDSVNKYKHDFNDGVGVGVGAGPLSSERRSKISHCSPHRIRDGTEALTWLRGTEVQKLLRGSEDVTMSLLDEVRQYYYNTVAPLLSRLESINHWHQRPALDDFYYAYSLVSSRAFLVDAYHCLAMVPVADAFNHSNENHVHLESDFDVCNTCGSVHECAHDSEEFNGHQTHSDDNITCVGVTTTNVPQGKDSFQVERDECYEMVANAPILPNCEVFNTYGDKLGNADLLVRYGFAIDGNEWDRISWDLEELWDDVNYIDNQGTSSWSGRVERVTKSWVDIVENWSDRWEELFSKSEFVYVNTVGGVWTTGGGGNEGNMFCMNSDGKITHQMWLYCALLNLDDSSTGSRPGHHLIEDVIEAADLQLELEREVGGGEYDDVEQVIGGQRRQRQKRESSKMPAVTGVMCKMLSLCRAKKGQIGTQEGNWTETDELGVLADGIPEDMTRTRLAIAQAMGERSILDCCEANWRELVESVCKPNKG